MKMVGFSKHISIYFSEATVIKQKMTFKTQRTLALEFPFEVPTGGVVLARCRGTLIYVSLTSLSCFKKRKHSSDPDTAKKKIMFLNYQI